MSHQQIQTWAIENLCRPTTTVAGTGQLPILVLHIIITEQQDEYRYEAESTSTGTRYFVQSIKIIEAVLVRVVKSASRNQVKTSTQVARVISGVVFSLARASPRLALLVTLNHAAQFCDLQLNFHFANSSSLCKLELANRT